MTVLELYNHVSSFYKEDKEFFKKAEEILIASSPEERSEVLRPLGAIGDITLNQLFINLKELKWESLVHNTQITINVVPFCANLVGYGIILRGYLKLVHNRPLNPNLSNLQGNLELKNRNRNLALFALMGAPITLVLLKAVSPTLKDIVTISWPVGNDSQLEKINNSLIPGFTVFNYLNKKIPYWVKLLFRLLLLSLLVLKLLGINILDFISSIYYLRIYCYVSCTFIIIRRSM